MRDRKARLPELTKELRRRIASWRQVRREARRHQLWHPALGVTRRMVLVGLTTTASATAADAGWWLRVTANVVAPAYAAPKLSPSTAWSSAVASLPNGAIGQPSRDAMTALVPPKDTTYYDDPGSTTVFPEEATAQIDEVPMAFLDQANSRVVVFAGNADPNMRGITKVRFYLADSYVDSTDMVFTGRLTSGFPVDLSSADLDGDVTLTYDVYPVRGYVTRGTLPLTLATNGTIKRPKVYVNPDASDHTNVLRTDDGATITVSAGVDTWKLSDFTASDLLNGNPAKAFKTIQKAQGIFGGYGGHGACDILVTPNNTLSCDQPVDVVTSTGDQNNNVRMCRVRSVTAGQKYKVGRNDKAGFYATPGGDLTVYAAPSPAYGGAAGGTGQPVYDPVTGEQIEPYLSTFSGWPASTGGGYYWKIACMEMVDAYVDTGSFRGMATTRITPTLGYVGTDGAWVWGQQSYCWRNCIISNGFSSNGPPTGYPNNSFSDQRLRLQMSSYGAVPIALCEVQYLDPGFFPASMVRNVTGNVSYDTGYSQTVNMPFNFWNVVAYGDQEGVTRQCAPYALRVNNVVYREDWYPSSNTAVVSGSSVSFNDGNGNAVAHGLSVGDKVAFGTGPLYVKGVVQSVPSASTVTLTTSPASGTYSGYARFKLVLADQGNPSSSATPDRLTVSCLDYDGFPASPKLAVGDVFVIDSGTQVFKTTVENVGASSFTLSDPIPSFVSNINNLTYYCGFTVITCRTPSSKVGGYHNFYYAKTASSLAAGKTRYMNDFNGASGEQVRFVTGNGIGRLAKFSEVFGGSFTDGLAPAGAVGVIPASQLPTMSTVGTALTLSAAPSVLGTGNAPYNGAALFIGQQIVNDATDETCFVVAINPTDPTKATLSASFTDGNGNSVNLSAVAYRSGGSVAIDGDARYVQVGDQFWYGAIGHSDYLQHVPRGGMNPCQSPAAKNHLFYNYTVRSVDEQQFTMQYNYFGAYGGSTLTTDGSGNGVISVPQSSGFTTPAVLSTSTNTSTGVTTCTVSDQSGNPLPHNLYAGQRVMIPQSGGGVTVAVVSASTGSSTFTLVTPLAADVTNVTYGVGHTVLQGDMVLVGPKLTNSNAQASRRVTSVSWGADGTQRLTFNEDFASSLNSNASGAVTGVSYTSYKSWWNMLFVNSNYYYLGSALGGSGFGGAMAHWAWIQSTMVSTKNLNNQTNLSLSTGFGSTTTVQNSGMFDSVFNSVSNDRVFDAIRPQDLTRKNVTYLQPHNLASGYPAGSVNSASNEVATAMTWDDATARPTSKTHLRVLGRLNADGTPMGKGLAPWDRHGNPVIAGVSFVGGSQPLAA